MKKDKRTDKLSVVEKLILATAFFNIWFPKAGIKISETPITLGSIVFAITIVIWLVDRFSKKNFRVDKVSILILIMASYFIVRYLIVGGPILSYLSYIIPICIFPVIHVISLNYIDSEIFIKKYRRIIVLGFYFLTVFALMQFIFGLNKLVIPGVTVNLTDYLENPNSWYMAKNNIVSGSYSKIVSTYQNGNLFGINILLLFPFVFNDSSRNSKKKQLLPIVLFLSTILLTLSRACWIGGLLEIMLLLYFSKRRGSIKISHLALLFIVPIISVYLVSSIPSISDRINSFNTKELYSMSGRTDGLRSVIKTSVESNRFDVLLFGPEGIIPYKGIAYEMVPLALFTQGGIIGVIVFYAAIIEMISTIKTKRSRVSLITWSVVGIIEGSLWLTPTSYNLFASCNVSREDKE